MNVNGKMLAALLACAVIAGTSQSRADVTYTVDPGATWVSWVNHALVGGGGDGGFGYDPALAPATFSGPVLTLSPNTDIFTANGGGTGAENVFWFTGDGSGTPTRIVEVNTYQEEIRSIGELVTFNYDVTGNTVPVGYEAVAFIKVLDGGASWATTQLEQTPLVPGPNSLSFTVADAGAGTETVQAGFYLKGLYVDPANPIAGTGVTIIPEPSTLALALIGLAGFMARKRRV